MNADKFGLEVSSDVEDEDGKLLIFANPKQRDSNINKVITPEIRDRLIKFLKILNLNANRQGKKYHLANKKLSRFLMTTLSTTLYYLENCRYPVKFYQEEYIPEKDETTIGKMLIEFQSVEHFEIHVRHQYKIYRLRKKHPLKTQNRIIREANLLQPYFAKYEIPVFYSIPLKNLVILDNGDLLVKQRMPFEVRRSDVVEVLREELKSLDDDRTIKKWLSKYEPREPPPEPVHNVTYEEKLQTNLPYEDPVYEKPKEGESETEKQRQDYINQTAIKDLKMRDPEEVVNRPDRLGREELRKSLELDKSTRKSLRTAGTLKEELQSLLLEEAEENRQQAIELEQV
ncbi:hypothetical protein SNEBB_002015 [Seison nebaliae]|nr:hypothetical protein SNEBB_002015 [Seison nebaliae]